ncbi:SDR family oxidoreductase [Sphingomonas sp. CGMCC 1.13654]|uniref:SDR family oxidoreductase n=1 Tax=Sphingomonas chungangi TaxID=2683589 RepID=A0A838L6Y8_9SPHN|nr:SDR family oxidoreductase [Sphingomonas chungangi]
MTEKAILVIGGATPIGAAVVRAAAEAGYGPARQDGPIDALFVAPFAEAPKSGVAATPADVFASTIDCLLADTMHATRTALPRLLERQGALVFSAPDADIGIAAIAASAAVETLVRSIAYQYGAHGIRANVIRTPGPASPAGPEDVARLALFLLSADASFMTGAIVRADAPPDMVSALSGEQP